MPRLSTIRRRRRDDWTLLINVPRNAGLKTVKTVFRDISESDPRVLAVHKPIEIGVLALAKLLMQITLRPCVNNDNYFRLRCDFLERIRFAIDQHGIEIPFQKLDRHVEERQI